MDLIGAISVGLIIWYAGGNALNGAITLGTVMAFLQFNEMFWRPIRDLSEKYNILQTAMASSERIFQLLDDKTVPSSPPSPALIHDLQGEIEFRNVWFAYHTPSDGANSPEWVLKNISLHVQPGQTVALVGHTGAGKTSIISLLSRFYEHQKGEILIDGVNVDRMQPEDLRKHIAVVLQDVFLFSGNIKGNINLGDESISIDRVKAAARVVGAHRFIEQLPNQYDAEVKERGATLSVGQKQLLSFAARWLSILAFWSWMRRRPASTLKRNCLSRQRSKSCSKAVPPSLSLIAFPPSRAPTRLSFSIRGKFAKWELIRSS